MFYFLCLPRSLFAFKNYTLSMNQNRKESIIKMCFVLLILIFVSLYSQVSKAGNSSTKGAKSSEDIQSFRFSENFYIKLLRSYGVTPSEFHTELSCLTSTFHHTEGEIETTENLVNLAVKEQTGKLDSNEQKILDRVCQRISTQVHSKKFIEFEQFEHRLNVIRAPRALERLELTMKKADYWKQELIDHVYRNNEKLQNENLSLEEVKELANEFYRCCGRFCEVESQSYFNFQQMFELKKLCEEYDLLILEIRRWVKRPLTSS